MRALSVRQPFAWAVAHGGKRVENRSRPFHFQGPIAIHAGKGRETGTSFGSPGCDAITYVAERASVSAATVAKGSETRGCVVAVARLDRLCSESRYYPYGRVVCGCGPWAVGSQHHLILAAVRPLAEPVPCKGMLGLWRLPPDVEAAVMAQLAEVASRG